MAATTRRIALSRDAAVSNDGHIYMGAQSIAPVVYSELTLPTGVAGLGVRPSLKLYNKRLYIDGMFSSPLVVLENGTVQVAGIPAPDAGPTVVAGTGSGGSSGVAICSVRFGQRIGATVVAVGNRSAQAPSITLTGQGRAWSALPTTCSNPRVNIIQGLVSMDGEPAAVAWTRVLGTTTVTENVLTAELGELVPVKVLANGTVTEDVGALGVPPYCKYSEVYHDALWRAGDPQHPERIYPSKLFEPEAVNTDPDNATWLTTRDGLPVTGLHVWRDQLIVGTARSLQVIQGYGPNDYSIEFISNYTGVLSHASMVTFGPQGDMLFASQDGVNLYDGGTPRNLMAESLRYYWRDDFLAHPANYEASFACHDRFFDVYLLHIPQADTTMFRYVGTLKPLLRGDAPDWGFDLRSRQDNAVGELLISDYGYSTYVGSCDGNIYGENESGDPDDLGDAYGKRYTLQTGAVFADNDQAGDDDHGANWKKLDLFIQSDSAATTVSLYAGDETASDAATPQWSEGIQGDLTDGKVVRTSWHRVLNKVTGKSVTIHMTGTGSTDFSYRGYAISYEGGRQVRLATS